jgi:hypothetical protein
VKRHCKKTLAILGINGNWKEDSAEISTTIPKIEKNKILKIS